ncbi:hypothetical protein AB0J71_48500 [Nonomuraea sp. NPDC049637]|uniref:hypothetical protein n=1 Tax=Nonomuraea sp. NPDC049637 TaxID=3154356 RepID=UPI0034273D81
MSGWDQLGAAAVREGQQQIGRAVIERTGSLREKDVLSQADGDGEPLTGTVVIDPHVTTFP